MIELVYTAVAHGLSYLCNLCSIVFYAHMYSFMQEAASVMEVADLLYVEVAYGGLWAAVRTFL